MIPLMGMCLDKTIIQKDRHSYVHSRQIVKTWKQPKCPLTDEWIKMWYIYTMEYYLAIKRTNNAICRNRDTTRDYHY